MPDLSTELAKLRQQYRARLPLEIAELCALAAQLRGQEMDRPLLETLRARLHKLAGSGGTFGFGKLSDHARELEQTTRTWLDGDLGQVDGSQRQRFVAALTAMPLVTDSILVVAPETDSLVDGLYSDNDGPRVWLVDDDVALGEELSRLLAQFGYQVRLFARLEDVGAAAVAECPDLLLMDVVFPEERLNAIEEIKICKAFQTMQCPIVFISAYTNFRFQMDAVRLGAKGFLTKPVDVPKLVDQMERILAERQGITARVLVVDDDELLRERFRQVLVAAGMEVEVLRKAEEIIECVYEFRPELILMDVHMPDYSGIELATLIRFYDEWVGLPIVYLSTEPDLDKQIKAMEYGADDFLTKPISDLRLVAAVKARAVRTRQLSDLITKDSLTGLYKHAHIKEQLGIELNRARRDGSALSLAMLDIDCFKQINDGYGHVVGDRVIRAVANLLKQRLRKSDIIGRYGGEEFLVILPGCDAQLARRILDDIRKSFSALRFYHETREFSCSLSVGVACNQQYLGSDPTSLLVAADTAMYRAKRTGRDQVCVADGVTAA